MLELENTEWTLMIPEVLSVTVRFNLWTTKVDHEGRSGQNLSQTRRPG